MVYLIIVKILQYQFYIKMKNKCYELSITFFTLFTADKLLYYLADSTMKCNTFAWD